MIVPTLTWHNHGWIAASPDGSVEGYAETIELALIEWANNLALHAELVRGTDVPDALTAADTLAASIGWRVHSVLRRHSLDGDDPPLWEATARDLADPSQHHHGEGPSMEAALAELIGTLRQLVAEGGA